MMRRFTRARLLLPVAALALLATACSTTTTTPAAAPVALDIALDDFTVAVSGDAPADTPLLLRVRNDGAAPHSVGIEVVGTMHETRVLNSGGTETLQVPALAEGTYTLVCTVPGHKELGMETTLVVGSGHGPAHGDEALSPDEIDRLHAEGIEAFPAETERLGGQVLEPRIENGVKIFELTAAPVRWEVSPGHFVDAYAYSGQIPGPEIRVSRGDRMRVILRNDLPESTSIHFHGLTLPNAMDGVPFITQDPVRPGESFVYEFPIRDEPGTHMYHSHHNAAAQVGKGLLGALVIEDPDPAWDVEYTMIVGDGPLGYTINGKGFPATQPLVVERGQRVLVRFLNEGALLHPMHLHGFPLQVIARDGRPLPQPYLLDTVTVAPGERWDAVFTATIRGVWAFHCHILTHAESEHGMHGMVTAVVVQ